MHCSTVCDGDIAYQRGIQGPYGPDIGLNTVDIYLLDLGRIKIDAPDGRSSTTAGSGDIHSPVVACVKAGYTVGREAEHRLYIGLGTVDIVFRLSGRHD